MKYVVVYGQEYLKDFGAGWTRWTMEATEAMRFDNKVDAFKTAVHVEAGVIPYLEPEKPLMTFCGAV